MVDAAATGDGGPHPPNPVDEDSTGVAGGSSEELSQPPLDEDSDAPQGSRSSLDPTTTTTTSASQCEEKESPSIEDSDSVSPTAPDLGSDIATSGDEASLSDESKA